jgi:hypothetical protein
MEPLSSGAPFGPGPGPESLPSGPQMGNAGQVSVLLAKAAQATGSPVLSQLAAKAQAVGQ